MVIGRAYPGDPWREVPDVLPYRSMNEVPEEIRAEAHAWALEKVEEHGNSVEFWMAQWFSNTVALVQATQPNGRDLPAPVHDDVMAEIEDYRRWQAEQERIAELLKSWDDFAQGLKKAVGVLMDEFAKAAQIVRESPVVQQLLDHHAGGLPVDPGEPQALPALCPSHGRPMKGGRCVACDRRRR